ncbi:hypothetical protein ACIQXF_19400 [Lysinibacillus sp. NPDC097231]|uniref:hypothetical protein n=1 Tax=Lysinibacillus sp. NPDC097231 TaxID=3364142 RepID=UPI00382CB86B
MDEKMKNLGRTLNETVLKDIHFNEKNKENVRQMIHIRRKKQRSLKPIFNYLLPTAVMSLFLLGIIYLIVTELEEQQIASYNNSYEDVPHEPKIETNLYTPPLHKESYENMTKEDVVSKLLNTVDYFHTAAGKFKSHDVMYDDSVSTAVIEYKISLTNEIGGYEKITTFYDKESSEETFYNNEKYWSKYIGFNGIKTYVVHDYQPIPTLDKMTPEDAFSIELKNIYKSDTKFRERPPIGVSGISLFPYEKAASYLRTTQHWEIEKQNEELLGHNTIVLFGKTDKEVIERTKMKGTTDTFRFWVDKETGILIKYETYDTNGELTSYLHPESLEVNVQVDPREFVPNLEGYQLPYRKNMYTDPSEAEIEVVDTADAIKEDTDAVLDLLRKDLPFLYEFTHPDLEIFSASYEKYKNFNQAYLTYVYKNEAGIVYVRAYHKDSVIRSIRDFNMAKGEQIEKFTLNGIEWECYKLNDYVGSHFIGKKGDYKYEVVSQKIPLQESKDLLKSFKPIK